MTTGWVTVAWDESGRCQVFCFECGERLAVGGDDRQTIEAAKRNLDRHDCEQPLYATPEGQAALRRWHEEDPDSYCQWLDDQWKREQQEP
jgi:hypothetical protein